MEKYILVLAVLIISSIIYLKLAVKYKIIDKPNERSSHTKITVRGGGILFPIAILLFFILNDYQYPYFCLAVFVISIVSFLDDIYTLSSKIRFPFQVLASTLVLLDLGLPIDSYFLLFIFFALGIAMVNMFNFMDGVNGITGLFSFATLSGLYVINNIESIINQELLIYEAISILVFGFYNFRKKAIFFAGDIGSVSIGLFLSFVGSSLAISLDAPIILLLVLVYGADSVCTLLYRKIFTNESVLDPHRHHMYQKIVDVYGVSHLKVSITYALIQIGINFIVFTAYKLDVTNQIIIMSSVMLFFTFFYIVLFKMIEKKKSNAS